MTVNCRKCGASLEVNTPQVINVGAHPELKEALKSGQLSTAVCPSCGQHMPLKYETLYHDPEHRMMLWLCTDELSAAKADAIVRSTEGLEDYRLRLVDSFGDLIEKVCIADAGLDDIVVELCKYVVKLDLQDTMKGDERLPAVLDAPFKFLRSDGADNALTFAYPLDGQMEMLEVPFSMYENCMGIVGRNPVFRQHASGFARVDKEWLAMFIK